LKELRFRGVSQETALKRVGRVAGVDLTGFKTCEVFFIVILEGSCEQAVIALVLS
jgi:hypothetical protein